MRCVQRERLASPDHPRRRGAKLLQCPDTAGKCRADLTLLNSVHSAEAYARLRRYSRTERRKIVELATELVASSEELSRTMRAIESGPEQS